MNKNEIIADKLYGINAQLSAIGYIRNKGLSVEEVRNLNQALAEIIKELREK